MFLGQSHIPEAWSWRISCFWTLGWLLHLCMWAQGLTGRPEGHGWHELLMKHPWLFPSFLPRLVRVLCKMSRRGPLCFPGGHWIMFLRGGTVLWLWTWSTHWHRKANWDLFLQKLPGLWVSHQCVSTCYPTQSPPFSPLSQETYGTH